MKLCRHHAQPNGSRTVPLASGVGALALIACIAAGCGDAQVTPNAEGNGQSIIGGISATNDAVNHTGALVATFRDDPPIEICTTTVIAPEVTVTAKHCVDILPMVVDYGYGVAFAVGPDSSAPLELIPIAGFDRAPIDEGGFTGMGLDVGVLYLDHLPATPIVPVEVRSLGEDRVGASMVTLGFGDYGASGAWDGRRRIGRETVAAVEGLTFEAMFGDFESFLEWLYTGQVTDEDFLEIVGEDPFALELYESEVLYPGHEAVTGIAPTDTQSCYGDSGGPLARVTRDGTWVSYGVVNGGVNSLRSECDFGTVFSTFGPESLAFLQASRQWEDPCGDVTAAGECLNGTAIHCETDLLTGTREVVEEDCIAQGKQCVIVPSGAACGIVVPATSAQRLKGPGLDIPRLIRERYLFTARLDLSWQ
jgi:hypothetical protein